jgi:short-subunit dehydrogenase
MDCSSYGLPDKFAQLLGRLLCIYFTIRFFSFMHLHFLRFSDLPRYRHSRGEILNIKGGSSRGRYQAWAFVTGASDGIGRGFAEELLHRGFNVILHGRNAAKLEGVKSELAAQWPEAELRIAVLDAHPFGAEAVEKLVRDLHDLHITVLVNNVGGSSNSSPTWRTLTGLEPADVDTLIGVNLRFATHLTRALMPTLVRSSPSLIVNVGSFAADMPAPYLTIYSGSKAYIQAWSRSLSAEMIAEGFDVEVLGLVVGEVQAQHTTSNGGPFKPSSRAFARSALHKVGCGRALVVPYAGHVLQRWVLGCWPEWLQVRILVDVAKKWKASEAESLL